MPGKMHLGFVGPSVLKAQARSSGGSRMKSRTSHCLSVPCAQHGGEVGNDTRVPFLVHRAKL